MAYARNYDVAEVKGMLMIAENSANITSFKNFQKKNPKATLAKAPVAHAGTLHAGKTQADLGGRADTGPASCSSYKDFDTLVLATTEALNSAQGQAALGTLDGGASDATFNAPLTNNLYYASRATRTTKKKGTGSITHEPYMVATQAFVKVCAYIAGKLWIQTSYPSQCNLRADPTIADLP
jgi:hypothetical protein